VRLRWVSIEILIAALLGLAAPLWAAQAPAHAHGTGHAIAVTYRA
jgi:hypothetical protein